jgi:hypothetical protein
VVCTMKCLWPPQHTERTVWHSSFLVVSLTRKSPSWVNSRTTSSRGRTPWNHSSSTRDLFVVIATCTEQSRVNTYLSKRLSALGGSFLSMLVDTPLLKRWSTVNSCLIFF